MKISFRLSVRQNHAGESEILLTAKKRVDSKVITMRAKSEVFCLPEFFSKEKGVELSRRRVVAYGVRQAHISAKEKLDGIVTEIEKRELSDSVGVYSSHWLQDAVSDILHPKKNESKARQTFYEMADEHIRRGNFSEDLKKHLRSIVRCVARFEGYTKKMKDSGFTFDVEMVNRNTIDDFANYVRHEKQLADKYPTLYQKLLTDYPNSVTVGNRALQ